MEIFNNIFDDTDLQIIFDKVQQPKWRYGHGSHTNGSGIPFWIMELDDDVFFYKYCLNIIRDKVNQPALNLEHVYANGHVFGDKGMPHVDSYHDDGATFLFYANEHWDRLWGGQTQFDFGNNRYASAMPARNRAVYFPGKITHYAEEVSRTFTGLRITIAWKLNGAKF
jgi:hypothetical protein